MKKVILGIGDILTNSDGIYEIIGFNEKGDTIATVRECIYNDDGNNYILGNEHYFTDDEVRNCLKFEYGINCRYSIKSSL